MLNLIYISLLVVPLAIAFIGKRYVYFAKNVKQKKESKQSYVRNNINRFGVNNRGTSMDKQNIFVVSPSELGI